MLSSTGEEEAFGDIVRLAENRKLLALELIEIGNGNDDGFREWFDDDDDDEENRDVEGVTMGGDSSNFAIIFWKFISFPWEFIGDRYYKKAVCVAGEVPRSPPMHHLKFATDVSCVGFMFTFNTPYPSQLYSFRFNSSQSHNKS